MHRIVSRIIIAICIMVSVHFMVSTMKEPGVSGVLNNLARLADYWHQDNISRQMDAKEQKAAAKAKAENEASNPEDTMNTIDARNALTTFVNYHVFLTDRKYARAYQMLSDDYQKNIAGKYENWASSFAATKESVVDTVNIISQTESAIIIQYTLHTVVAEGSGDVRKNLAGEATMHREGPVWLIDKIKEHQI